MQNNKEGNNIEKDKDDKLHSNIYEGSSSDTDKTSEVLFNAISGGIDLSRIKELPNSFYNNGYYSLDEFLSATSTSDNQTNSIDIINNKFNSVTTKKHVKNWRATTSVSLDKNAGANSSKKGSKTSLANNPSLVSSLNKERCSEQDVINEMNRQYDHNLCLNRFISQMEQMQKKKDSTTESSITEGRNNSLSNFSSDSSSVAPQSNEDTDSTSRNSESIRSSNPENTKAESNSSSKDIDDPIKEEIKQTVSSGQEKGDKDEINIFVEDASSSSNRDIILPESGVDVSSFNKGSEEANNEKLKNYKGGKLGRKRKRDYIYDPKPVIEKPSKKHVPTEEKSKSYWEKRKRNNEAAKKSREMRRLKEVESNEKLCQLKKENEALRVAITLLIQRNESLECIIDELE